MHTSCAELPLLLQRVVNYFWDGHSDEHTADEPLPSGAWWAGGVPRVGSTPQGNDVALGTQLSLRAPAIL